MGFFLVDSQRDEVYQYLLVDVGGVADITTLIRGGELVLARRLRSRFEEIRRAKGEDCLRCPYRDLLLHSGIEAVLFVLDQWSEDRLDFVL